ncbi:MAG: SGNH/GDSL hydrolase family protein [archaeon]
MAQILIFGTSIECGAWDVEGGWVERLRKFLYTKMIDSGLDNDYYHIIYNLGIDGENSSGLLKRFELEIKPRIWPEEETIVIICSGANDTALDNQTKKLALSPEKFKQNLEKIFQIAKKYSDKIVFVNDLPVDESKTDPVFWDKNLSYKNKHIEKVFEIAKKSCTENEILLVDIHSQLKSNYQELLIDGLHPNSRGHEQMFNIVKDFLIKKKCI